MVPPQEKMHSVYEKYDDEDYPEYKAYIESIDDSVAILLKVDVYPTVEEAETHYNENEESYDEPNTYGFADEAVKQVNGDYAEMTIRVSNAVGHVISYVPDEAPEEPDERWTSPSARVLAFGEDLHDYWAGTSDYKNQPGFCRQEVMDLQQPNENN